MSVEDPKNADKEQTNDRFKLLWKYFPELFGEHGVDNLTDGLIWLIRNNDTRFKVSSLTDLYPVNVTLKNPHMLDRTKLPGDTVQLLYTSDDDFNWNLDIEFTNEQGGGDTAFALAWGGRAFKPNPFSFTYRINYGIGDPLWYQFYLEEEGVTRIDRVSSDRDSYQRNKTTPLLFVRDIRHQHKYKDYNDFLSREPSIQNLIRVISCENAFANIHFYESSGRRNQIQMPKIDFQLPLALAHQNIYR